MISYVKVRYDNHARGRIAYVTIENEAKLNSLSSAVMTQFVDLFRGLSADLALRAVVLSGAGDKAFIGGASIDEMGEIDGPDQGRVFIEKVHACCRAIRQTPAPVIAAVNGWCLGAGMEVAAACDMRIAADTAMFGMPEVRLGIPSVVEAALLPSLIGWGRTRRILMTGEVFNAPQALSWGFIEDMRPQATLYAAVEDLLDELLAAEPRAVQLQKALIQQWEELPLKAAIDVGIDAFADAWTTDEPMTAMARYLADRKAAKARSS